MKKIFFIFLFSLILPFYLEAAGFNLSRFDKFFPVLRFEHYQVRIIKVPPLPLEEKYNVRGGFFDASYESATFYLSYAGKLYAGFSLLRFQYPKANVFCRMENASCNRYGVMFSIHAGNSLR